MKELLLYSEDVLTKPKLLVLNKMDGAGADEKCRTFRDWGDGLTLQGGKVFLISQHVNSMSLTLSQADCKPLLYLYIDISLLIFYK